MVSGDGHPVCGVLKRAQLGERTKLTESAKEASAGFFLRNKLDVSAAAGDRSEGFVDKLPHSFILEAGGLRERNL